MGAAFLLVPVGVRADSAGTNALIELVAHMLGIGMQELEVLDGLSIDDLGKGLKKDRYFLLTPNDDLSEDPQMGIRVLRIVEVEDDRIAVVLTLENRSDSEFAVTELGAALFDANEREWAPTKSPTKPVPAKSTGHPAFTFKAKKAKGTMEVRLSAGARKIWPVVFSSERPMQKK